MPRKNKKNSEDPRSSTEEQKPNIPDEGTEEYTNWLFKNYTKDSFFKKYITPQILSEYGLFEDALKKVDILLVERLIEYALKYKNVDFSVVASEALWECLTNERIIFSFHRLIIKFLSKKIM